MTGPVSTTLSKTDSCQLDGLGNGLITLRPDMGQNWAPLFVRVSTATRVSPVAYCAVYHGSPGVPVQQSQFIDDTFTGSGDTSSMIAGTPVLFGEALLFQFQNGTPGDTAIATVYGQNSSLPPNLDLVPQVPGTHFQGHLATEITSTLVDNHKGADQIILSGATVNSQIFDVRQFQSYYFTVTMHAGPAVTNYDQVIVDFYWTSDASQNPFPLGPVTYPDQYAFWADSAGVPAVALGPARMQDTMHGPYMQFAITNNGPDTIHGTWSLLASSRPLPGPYVRQGNAPDGVLVSDMSNIPGGGTLTLPLPLAYGEIDWWLFNQGAAAMTPQLDYQLPGIDDVAPPVPANTLQSFRFIMPKRGALLHINGTAGQPVVNRVITSYQKS